MAENKTQENEASVKDFINSIADATQKTDCKIILKIFEDASGYKPKMWGKNIIGFGKYRYKSKSREGDWFLLGFAPLKGKISIYTMYGLVKPKDLLDKLGKFKIEGTCLHIRKLEDVDLEVFKQLIQKISDITKETCKTII
jgi:hypothetical protein